MKQSKFIAELKLDVFLKVESFKIEEKRNPFNLLQNQETMRIILYFPIKLHFPQKELQHVLDRAQLQ